MTEHVEQVPARLERFLRRVEVTQTTGLSTSSIYEFMSEGKFPKPVKLNPDSQRSPVAWRESEIQDWQKQRIAARDAAA